MVISKKVLAAVIVLTLAVIACGSQPEVIVKTPESGEDTGVSEPQSEESTTAESTATKAVGTARSNPAPVGSEIIADEMSFVILSATRPATDIIKAGYVYNENPEAVEGYILVGMQITCLKSSDETCSFNPLLNVKVIGSLGVEYEMKWVIVGVDNLSDSTEFYMGAQQSAAQCRSSSARMKPI